MTMPQRVEKYKHYADRDAFREDEPEMADAGWRIEEVRPREVEHGPLQRLALQGPSHTELDVRYTRDRWRDVGHG